MLLTSTNLKCEKLCIITGPASTSAYSCTELSPQSSECIYGTYLVGYLPEMSTDLDQDSIRPDFRNCFNNLLANEIAILQ